MLEPFLNDCMHVYMKILVYFKRLLINEKKNPKGIFLRLFCFVCHVKVKEPEIADKKKLKALGLKSSRKRDKKSDSSVVTDSSPVCTEHVYLSMVLLQISGRNIKISKIFDIDFIS